MVAAQQWLKIEYYTNVDDFFNTIKNKFDIHRDVII